MTIKPKTYKEQVNEKERGKKRFLERRIEEQEAEKEIEQYHKEEVPGRVNEVSDHPSFPEREDI